jgi:hypothetical protein
MKILKYITLVVMLGVFASCKQEKLMIFNSVDRMQFTGDTLIFQTFVYDDASVTRDTVFLTLNTIGNTSEIDRTINIEQVLENVDNRAEAGTHFISFDNSEIFQHLVIKANTVKTKVPIILLRDASLKDASFRLRVRVVANKFFKTGESNALERLIIFSDNLERPKGWNSWFAKYIFGAYGKVKHQFMMDVSGRNIDEGFFKSMWSPFDYSMIQFYQNMFKKALKDHNVAHLNNPLREEPKEGQTEGDLVMFK